MSRPPIVFDVETYMTPQLQSADIIYVPKLVCLTWTDSHQRARLVGRGEAISLFCRWLDEGRHIIGHNVRFDLLALLRATWEDTGRDRTGDVLRAVKAGLVGDTQLREALLCIAGGGIPAAGLGLGTLVKKHFGVDIGEEKKNPSAWRKRYAELARTPVHLWPQAAQDYAIDDTDLTRRLWLDQQERAEEGALAAQQPGFVQNELFQVAASLWGGLLCARGLCVDYEWALALSDEYDAREEEAARELRRDTLDDGTPVTPLLRENGTMDTQVKRDLFSEAYASLGEEPPRTNPSKRHPEGQVKTSQDEMKYLDEMDATGPRFRFLAQYNQAQKFKSAYLAPILEAGSLGLPLHHQLNVLVDSGRTSARGPNVQNFPAYVKAAEANRALNGPMIRGCFIPRPGHVFIAADYSSIELSGLAQVMSNMTGELGVLAQVINAGKDPHLFMAARMLRMDYEDIYAIYNGGAAPKLREDIDTLDDVAQAAERAAHAGRLSLFKQVKRGRQFAKVINYGGPGGCSAKTLAQQAKQQGIAMTVAEAKSMLIFWKEVYPETRDYFDTIRRMEDQITGLYVCDQHGTGGATTGWRRRATDRYTSAANTFFQGICADGAKAAGWLLALACYADANSPLYGCAMVLFVHDEFVLECPADRATECMAELQRLMVAGMSKFIPDVRVATEGTVYTTRWGK